MDRCKYHSQQSPSWQCASCDIYYCTTCIPGGESNFSRNEPRCPCCQAPLNWLGSHRQAEPFWRISHRFFFYGSQPKVLMIMIVMAVGGMLIPTGLLMPTGLLGLGISLLLMGVLVRYGLNIIEALSQGDWQAPGLSVATGGDEEHLYVKQIIVYIILCVVSGAVAKIPILGLLVAAFLNLAFPACTMIFALTHSVFQSVNPLQLTALMLRIGWSYLLLWMAVSMVIGGPYILLHMGGEQMSLTLVYGLASAMTFYFATVAFAMMGYVLYEKSGELGFANYEDRGEDLEPQKHQRIQALGASNVLIRENQFDDARKVLNKALLAFPNDVELHERMHRLLMLIKDPNGVIKHTNSFCRLLIDEGNAGSAAKIYIDATTIVKKFVPDDPDVCYQLSESLFSQHKAQAAKQTLVNLHSRHKGYTNLGSAYLLLAKIYFEGLNDHENALKLTCWLQNQFADAKIAKEAASYEQIIMQVTSPSVVQ